MAGIHGGVLTALFAAVLVLPAGAPPAGAAAAPVDTGRHPYLFFRTEDLPELRRRSAGDPDAADAPPAAKFRYFLRRTCEKNLDREGDEVRGYAPDFAFYGLLAEAPAHRAKARNILLDICARPGLGEGFHMHQGSALAEAAIAYDLLEPDLTPAERERVERFLGEGARHILAGIRGDQWWGDLSGRRGNWRPVMYGGLGMAGLALWDRHPEARDWVGEATRGMKAVLDQDFDAEGGAYEAYVRYVLGVTYHSLVPYLAACRRVTGEDLFRHREAVLHRAGDFAAYLMQPARDAPAALGDTDAANYPAGLVFLTGAAFYDDPVAAWYLNELLSDRKRYWGDNENLWGTLWGTGLPAPQNPEASSRLALARAYRSRPDDPAGFGTGHFFLRTGFTRDDDIQFLGQAGDQGGFHGHADKGGYILNAYGVTFLRDYFSGPYEGEEFAFHHGSEAHQVLLIDHQGQGAQALANAVRNLDPLYWTKVADVGALEQREGHDYLRLDTTGAYRLLNANRDLRRAERHVVFVRGPERTGFFVVIDDVEKDESGHRYDHAFHYDPDEVTMEQAAGNRFVLAHPRACLHVVATWPAGPFTLEPLERYGDSYVKLSTDGPARFVLVVVLFPVRAGEPAPEIVAAKDRPGAVVGDTAIMFDPETRIVTVSGGGDQGAY